ncbi:aminotransferase class V-fold PLP-dependent enzyme [Kineobactrum salinum]|uniref:cysteine desulfurase n=1 Tax=Kineobactrum salinum TaxID=2708301 RepID=A0A6C0TZA7_9GAMM|nr:aminotransferase class V-fold PLP-dependent enzyme [Kineobactrum salinum]QIB64988.1 aminotransferase class V-fold PLP-dependent enzyme [Kineobactrum salinum]
MKRSTMAGNAHKLIYLDHAATSWPKPAGVERAMLGALTQPLGNPGRSGHRLSIAAAEVVEGARSALACLLSLPDPSRIAFTKNATEALNLGIFGLLEPGDHVITSNLEHNATMRPLRHLEQRGVALSLIGFRADGQFDLEALAGAIRPNTRLITTLHGSNVTGSVLPVEEICVEARRRNIPYLIDASQTAGSQPLVPQAWGADLVAITGHKGLLGPSGIGALYVREGLDLNPLIRGGTGSASEREQQPRFMPDCFESGTQNILGAAGLKAALDHISAIGIDAIARHESTLRQRTQCGLQSIPGVTVYEPRQDGPRCSTLSFNIDTLSCSDVGLLLDQKFGVMSRVGLHCAPAAHQAIGTYPAGTVRFGIGYSNTVAEIDSAVDAVRQIARWASHHRRGSAP